MKSKLIILLCLLLGQTMAKAQKDITKDTICIEDLTINGFFIGDSITKLIDLFGPPMHISTMLSLDTEHSLPTMKTYSYGDLEIFEILYPEYIGKIGGVKIEKGLGKLLFKQNIEKDVSLKIKDNLISGDLKLLKHLFPVSFKHTVEYNKVLTIKIKIKPCIQNSFISDINFTFEDSVLKKVETVFYLE